VGGFVQDWLTHEVRDSYWERLDVTERLPEIDVGVFAFAGLSDVFLEGTLEIFRRLMPESAGASLLVGPWYHIPWTSFSGGEGLGPDAGALRVHRAQLAFFDQWLRGAAPDGAARVTVFLTGANRWERLDAWPPPSRDWTLYLHSEFRANSLDGDGELSEEVPGDEPAEVYTYDPAMPVPSLGGRSCCFPAFSPMGPADQRPVEVLQSVLVFTSPPLERDHTVIGSIRVHLFAATSAADTDWTVKVCDVERSGRSVNIQEGIRRARFAGGYDQVRPVPAGSIHEYAFDVGSCAHVFRAGHRIRVEVSSSNFPHWDRNLNTGHPIGVDGVADRVVAVQTVLHERAAPSRVVLPLVD
jgi:putative CocE/NonD family hydrolase